MKTTTKTIGQILEKETNDVHQLPVGYTDPDLKKHLEFTLGEMTGHVDEAIADKKVVNNPGKVITEVVTHVVEKLGTLPVMKKEYARAMYQADRDFILLLNYIKSIATDDKLRWSENCRKCGDNMEIELNYNQIKVHFVDVGESPYLKFTLPRGVKKGEQYYKELTVKLPDGNTQEAIAASMGTGTEITSFLANTVESIEGLDSYNFNTFKDMVKKDRTAAAQFITEIQAGPDLATQVECPNCGKKSTTAVNVRALLGE